MDWISVNERCPDNDRTVIVTDGDKVYVGGYGYLRGKVKVWYMDNQDWDGMSAICAITHWMELPPMPAYENNPRRQQIHDEEAPEPIDEKDEHGDWSQFILP